MGHWMRITPGPGQESVWDYPRPPRLESTSKYIEVVFNGVTIAKTRRALRVLETSHPPVYYLPPEDVLMLALRPTNRRTFCEFKGAAFYFTVSLKGKTVNNVAWTFPDPVANYGRLTNYIAFYASRVDACYVEGERVVPQEGDFYGGWITRDIVGPFKGGPGTLGW